MALSPASICRAFPRPTQVLLLGLGMLGVACSDDGLKILESPPSVTITEPSAESSFYEGQPVNFVALVEVGARGDDITDVSHMWVTSNITMCESDNVGGDGYAYCTYAFTETGEHTIEITATDSRSDRAKASTTIIIVDNTPPSIEIIDPIDGELFAEDDLVRLDAIVGDVEEDPQELTVSISSSMDGDLGVTASPASSGDYTAGVYLNPGVHLLTARVEDSYGQSDQATVEIEIYEHGPPSVDSITILPNPANTTDTLTATPQGWYDLDGAPERFHYTWWYDDGTGTMVEDTGETTSTYPSGKTTKGDLIQVRATPYNDYGSGTQVESPTITIDNTAPDAPVIVITPSAPEPADNLVCDIDTASVDIDGDAVTYEYGWYQNGTVTAYTTNVVSSLDTAHGDTWECVVRAYDGEDYSTEARTSVSITDISPPDAPIIDTPDPYRNEDEVTLTGDCEPGCVLTLYCGDSSTSWTDAETCDSAGEFEYTTALTRGDISTCNADCEDAAGNISGFSNTISTEVCDPFDEYEDTSGYGDSGTNPVDEWASLNDAGTTTVTIIGNILGSDSEDWYVVSSSDDLASDYSAGIDYYNFDVALLTGSSDYAFLVYADTDAGGFDVSDMECSASYSTTGYTEYNDYSEDVGDGTGLGHAIPSDTRRCGSGSVDYNDCTDFSKDYYIQVFRRSSSTPSCQNFELEITNGVW
jgi:hypothetical protein